jgi:hypothetical protein
MSVVPQTASKDDLTMVYLYADRWSSRGAGYNKKITKLKTATLSTSLVLLAFTYINKQFTNSLTLVNLSPELNCQYTISYERLVFLLCPLILLL